MPNMSVRIDDREGNLAAVMVEWCRDYITKPDWMTNDEFDDACHRCAEKMAEAAYIRLLGSEPL